MTDKDDDAVGYGRPPRHSRFKPGQSGNPKGRPKGRRNVKTEIEALFNERVRVREGDKLKRVTMRAAMLMSQRAKALKGDTKSAAWLFGFRAQVIGPEYSGEEATSENLSAEDEAILAAFRLQTPPSADGPNEEPAKTDDQGGSPAAGTSSASEPKGDKLAPPDDPKKD